MEVTIHSTVNGAFGAIVLSADPNQTVRSLIRAFCAEKGIAHQSEFALTNCRQEVLQNNKKLSACGIQNGEELYLSLNESKSDDWAFGCNQWWILCAVTLVIGIVGIVAISYMKSKDYSPTYSYGIGIDAGSTHTKLYVYNWPVGKINGTGNVYEVDSCPKNESMKAISHFVDNPSLAGEELRKCLDRAQQLLPQQEITRSPIFLGATAGMRLLRESNASAAIAIMSSVRTTISSYKFRVDDIEKQVRIIEGNEEGTYSWITTNYLSGRFGFEPVVKLNRLKSNGLEDSPMLGALDLGGASTQITYVPQNLASLHYGNNETVKLYGYEHSVYSYSYLCYGIEEARRRYLAQLVRAANFSLHLKNPCMRKNNTLQRSYESIFVVPCTLFNHSEFDSELEGVNFTFTGTGETDLCRNTTLKLFDFNATCRFPSCSFDGVYQPSVYGSFLAFSGFYYLMAAFNLTHNSSLDEFEKKRDNYCTSTETLHPTEEGREYCFHSHYVYDILVDGYKFNQSNWHTISFQNKVHGTELGWILGMMINATNVIPVSLKTEMISLPVFIILVIVFSMFILLSFGFFCHARKERSVRYEVVMGSTSSYGAI